MDLMKFAVEHKYILIAFVTAIMGASARISYESENKETSRRKAFSYYTASLLSRTYALKFWFIGTFKN